MLQSFLCFFSCNSMLCSLYWLFSLVWSESQKKKLMICFCYFCYLGVANDDPFFVQIGPPKIFLEVLPIFFQNFWIPTQVININSMSQHISLEISQKMESGCGLQGQKLGQSRSHIVKKKQETGILTQWVFFIFCMSYTFKSKKQFLHSCHCQKQHFLAKKYLAKQKIIHNSTKTYILIK